ncbi:AT-rich interactive domain-containing protein 5A [Struthio camelus]|uniref:AT-rich interactive domain-containing protein 5A n=1 Tax=Struthio camelus TaxID=8801 RepID=UPI003603F280
MEEASQTQPASPEEDKPKTERNEAIVEPPPGGDVCPQEPAGPPRPEDEEERPEAKGEKEEEEAFLVSLYKFMKERRTPIERIPHLGFKQINLWKIYKAVEKLGAYELVTGRRLWKNVYDELGGSPGSTSAATCTRRHYERLVLPYVRHLKGEDDKPLPPAKPRKQYKVSKEPKGPEAAAERSKRAKKDKSRERVGPPAEDAGGESRPRLPWPARAPADKAKAEAASVPGGGGEEEEEEEAAAGAPERDRPAEGPPKAAAACPGPCRTHAEGYKRLLSSFYAHGSHPIMSPLAKKKLLAQVSEAEASRCPKRHCPESRRGGGGAARPGSGPEPPRPAGSSHPDERRSPEVAGGPSASPSLPLVPAVFTGRFHAYRHEVLKTPASRTPPPAYFSGPKDFAEAPAPFPPAGRERRPEEAEPRLAPRSRGAEGPAPAAFAAVRACWVPPGAAFSSAPPPPRGKRGLEEEEGEEEEEEEEEAAEAFGPSRKLQAVCPFGKDAQGRDKGAGSPGGQRRLAKPKAVVASPGYPAPLPAAVPRVQDVYKGAMLRFPVSFADPLEHLKAQGSPLVPNLSVNPFVIPAFPNPLIAASTQPSEPCRPLATGPGRYPTSYDSSLRHRLYPAAAWHGQPAYAPPFHRHTKL